MNMNQHKRKPLPEIGRHKEPETAQNKRLIGPVAVVVLLCGCVVLAACLGYQYVKGQSRRETVQANLLASGYYPVEQALELCGFTTMDGAYQFETGGQTVTLEFDLTNSICRKNQYTFNVAGQWVQADGALFLSKALLESITCHRIYMDTAGAMAAEPLRFAPDAWATDFSHLIAHSAGILRGEDKNQEYSNTMDALVQNYDLGHRVFEIDFQLTSDGNLAAVHEGWVPGDSNGIEMSAAQWLEYGGFWPGKTMLAGDVLDQMLINPDMFVVTDTKWHDNRAFQVLYREAQKRDMSLMDRIIPQIYNIDMYAAVMEVYDFPSVIFTDYTTTETPQEIIDFCAEAPNIHVVTTSAINGVVDEELVRLANQQNILVYAHTLNSYDDITQLRGQGVYGLYTDYLLPRDFEIYERQSQA